MLWDPPHKFSTSHPKVRYHKRMRPLDPKRDQPLDPKMPVPFERATRDDLARMLSTMSPAQREQYRALDPKRGPDVNPKIPRERWRPLDLTESAPDRPSRMVNDIDPEKTHLLRLGDDVDRHGDPICRCGLPAVHRVHAKRPQPRKGEHNLDPRIQ